MPDVIFISELIDKLEASYNIDPARIYANGLSNGGGVTFALSCTLSESPPSRPQIPLGAP
jgi:polyhydroxybutyrate depolymerase